MLADVSPIHAALLALPLLRRDQKWLRREEFLMSQMLVFSERAQNRLIAIGHLHQKNTIFTGTLKNHSHKKPHL